jgi:hypothetical protein
LFRLGAKIRRSVPLEKVQDHRADLVHVGCGSADPVRDNGLC